MENVGEGVVSLKNGEKCLVIGSTGYEGIDSVSWNSRELPNIVDFDLIIIDVRALDESTRLQMDPNRLRDIQKSLIRVLDSKGSIIVLSDFQKRYKIPNREFDYCDNYDWSPISIGVCEEAGDTITVIENTFPQYFSQFREWQYYFFLASNCLSSQLTNFYGSTHQTKYRLPITPFIKNRYDRVLAGSFKIEVRRARRKSDAYATSTYTNYPDEADHVTGEIILLPLIDKLDNSECVKIVLEDLTGRKFGYTPPAWSEAISVPRSRNVQKKLADKRGEIRRLIEEVKELKLELEEINKFKRLLYSSGSDLEEIVQECLENLGGVVSPAKYGQEEYILEHRENEHLIEVKGVSKSISLSHLRQLADYMMKYEEDTGEKCKGVLFGNAWRTIQPELRGSTESPEFPDNVIERAHQLEIALISSARFFEAYCRYMAGEIRGEDILDKIVNGIGIVDLVS